MMITTAHSQQRLSFAHLYAVTAQAGINISRPEDDYGVDAFLRPVQIVRGRMSDSPFGIDVQLKASVGWTMTPQVVKYDLDAAAYNRMVDRVVGEIPLYVFLLCLPFFQAEWITLSEEETVLRNCCYWYRATGAPTPNKTTISVEIPRTNLVTADALNWLIKQARKELVL
ncbi:MULTISPECIES: DUF4365 domain-containing protein [unclassified Bosea (in: a-proteobacteria)]|uniref:DUF4365 domain-containing protein n=1 Tax=unclassified Bosea (in: a-proteobacteria) TaxID=2653178 RepID=UPI000F75A6A0|nr:MULTISPECIES: DUF4365 domain-containing protein [unclassified Bosea (in: a-proteobacteria)]AZO77483.1 hypothetical protein BLM15_07555 [Bosea sp. Tri-49]RXT18088.1 hypothetical protein B5U98_22705 [Bosea sp. Tri-39]RXT32686.1 hypothetical protein B5U99_29050 [Bosea sp. Tri-54]